VRTPFLAGNWKMNLDRASAFELAEALAASQAVRADGVEVAVAPPAVYLELVVQAVKGSPIRVGTQNVAQATSGAYTGEISAAMVQDLGGSFAIVGHSERRHVYGETDKLINERVRMALEQELDVILCLGETLAERDGKQTEAVVREQLVRGLDGVSSVGMQRVTIAYEPVWAIGTGRTATPQQASEVHVYLRGLLAGLYDDATAEETRIQYGGSVKPDNAAELLAAEGIDGALVGGASLKARDFLAIVEAALARA
jgi:triosephosphate isomerase